MSAHHHYHLSRALSACCLLVLSACANPALDNQLAASREAIDQARTAGAPETSPADFNAASDKLKRANAAAEKRDKTGAMRLAEEAHADANLANAKTNAMHATTAATTAARLARSNQALREEIGRASQSK